MSSDTFYPAEGGHREAGERVATGSDRRVNSDVDLIARGMRWEDCEALMKEACAQAGVAWGEDEKPQSIAINVMMRVANAAHKAGFELGKKRMAAARDQQDAKPVDMVLHCPLCHLQHIDEAEVLPMAYAIGAANFSPGYVPWDNPPHRSHLCHGCGHIWRPADVPTNGVAAIKTTGKADGPVATARQSDWQPMTTAPTSGMILLTVEHASGERRVFPAEASTDADNLRWMITTGWTGWKYLHSGWTPVLWQRWLEAPVKTVQGKGDGQ